MLRIRNLRDKGGCPARQGGLSVIDRGACRRGWGGERGRYPPHDTDRATMGNPRPLPSDTTRATPARP